MIDPGGTSIGGDLTGRCVEGRFGGDLVDQAEPLASLDPLFEGRQRILIRDNELRLDPGRSPRFTTSNRPILPSPGTPRRPGAILGFASPGLPVHTPRRGPPFGGHP